MYHLSREGYKYTIYLLRVGKYEPQFKVERVNNKMRCTGVMSTKNMTNDNMIIIKSSNKPNQVLSF